MRIACNPAGAAWMRHCCTVHFWKIRIWFHKRRRSRLLLDTVYISCSVYIYILSKNRTHGGARVKLLDSAHIAQRLPFVPILIYSHSHIIAGHRTWRGGHGTEKTQQVTTMQCRRREAATVKAGQTEIRTNVLLCYQLGAYDG